MNWAYPIKTIYFISICHRDRTEEETIFHFNLTPLSCRRYIAMLGFIHRCALDKSPEHFKAFFTASSARSWNTRSASMRHGRQLLDIRNKPFLDIEQRSALGLIWVHNPLLGNIITCVNIKDFQRSLQIMLKQSRLSDFDDWKDTLSPRAPVCMHPLRCQI